MNDPIVVALARQLCTEVGLDPDDREDGESGELREKPEWIFHMADARRILAEHRALAAVLGSVPGPGRQHD